MHFKTESKETFHFLQEPPGIKDSDDDIEGYGTILIILNINNIFLNMKWLLHLHQINLIEDVFLYKSCRVQIFS